MADDLSALENWAEPLLAALTAAKRRSLARTIGQALRREQASRIAVQRNPDGSTTRRARPRGPACSHHLHTRFEVVAMRLQGTTAHP